MEKRRRSPGEPFVCRFFRRVCISTWTNRRKNPDFAVETGLMVSKSRHLTLLDNFPRPVKQGAKPPSLVSILLHTTLRVPAARSIRAERGPYRRTQQPDAPSGATLCIHRLTIPPEDSAVVAQTVRTGRCPGGQYALILRKKPGISPPNGHTTGTMMSLEPSALHRNRDLTPSQKRYTCPRLNGTDTR